MQCFFYIIIRKVQRKIQINQKTGKGLEGNVRRTDDGRYREGYGELIKLLENKLTAKAFAKEQRGLMKKKLREYIKTRDNFTCCICGNSTYKEPNLLFEIDHIIHVAKENPTVESNRQTLCFLSVSDMTI